MSEQNPVSAQESLAHIETVPAFVDRLIKEEKMPGITAKIFKDRWDLDEDSMPRKLTEKFKATIRDSAKDAIGYRVDIKRTGLELEVALREDFLQDLYDRLADYAQKELEAEEAGDIGILLKYVNRQLAEEDRLKLAADITELYADPVGVLDIYKLRDKALEYFLKAEERQHAFIAGDLQKLKACNDFGAFQVEGMDPQSYVDTFGFVELGRRWQALSSLLGSEQYQLPLDELEGDTRFDPLNNFEEVPISKEIYENEVRALADPELMAYCKEHKITIKLAAKRSAGDEMTIRVTKQRKDDGSANALTDTDLKNVMALVDSVSHVDIGVYTEDDAKYKRLRAKDIFQDKYNLPEGDLRIGFSIRLGEHRVDKIFEQGFINGNDIDTSLVPQEAMAVLVNNKLDEAIGKANEQMEINKRRETLEQLFEALNGDNDAQLATILVIEQARFPGDVGKLKELIAKYTGEPITEDIFEAEFVPGLERRSTLAAEERPVYRFSRDILVKKKSKKAA